MKCGIKFKIPNAYGALLYDILRGVIDHNTFWRIGYDEVYHETYMTAPTEDVRDKSIDPYIFSDYILRGDEFERAIRDNTYYAIFLDAYVYNTKREAVEVAAEEEYFHIKTYAEFSASKCIFAIAVCDNEFVDIAAKDEKIIAIIHENAENAGFTDIKIFTDDQDCSNLYLSSSYL